MLEKMPPELLAEWMALYQLEAEDIRDAAKHRELNDRAGAVMRKARGRR